MYGGMSIPALEVTGLLASGIHACNVDEIRARFGRFQGSDRRPRLMQKLEAFLVELRASAIVRAVIIDGSFVTMEESPNDVDLLIVLPSGHDFRSELGPAQYKVLDRRRVRRTFGLDILVAEEGSEDYTALVSFFHRVRLQPQLTKGILRLEL